MKCVKCGKELAEEEIYCLECGTKRIDDSLNEDAVLESDSYSTLGSGGDVYRSTARKIEDTPEEINDDDKFVPVENSKFFTAKKIDDSSSENDGGTFGDENDFRNAYLKNETDMSFMEQSLEEEVDAKDDVPIHFEEEVKYVKETKKEREKKKKEPMNMKGLVIGIVVILVLLCVGGGVYFFLNKPIGISKNHEKLAGGENYESTDVNYNCLYSGSLDKYNSDIKMDLLFNHNDYKAQVYFKIDISSKSKIDDKQYENIINLLGLTKNVLLLNDGEYDDNIKLAYTKYGNDTTITRQDKNVIITSNILSGSGEKAGKDDVQKVIDEYKELGYTCK